MLALKIIAWLFVAHQFLIAYLTRCNFMFSEDHKKDEEDRLSFAEAISVLLIRGLVYLVMFTACVYVISFL